jgi:hypothetical protein
MGHQPFAYSASGAIGPGEHLPRRIERGMKPLLERLKAKRLARPESRTMKSSREEVRSSA